MLAAGGEISVTFPTFLGKTCHISKNKLPQKFPPISLRSIRCSSYLISFFIWFLCHVFTLHFLCRFDSGDFYDAFLNLVIFTITTFFFFFLTNILQVTALPEKKLRKFVQSALKASAYRILSGFFGSRCSKKNTENCHVSIYNRINELTKKPLKNVISTKKPNKSWNLI